MFCKAVLAILLCVVTGKPVAEKGSVLSADPGLIPAIKGWNYKAMNRIPHASALFANQLKITEWLEETENAYLARYHQFRLVLQPVYLYEKEAPVEDYHRYRVTSGEEAWLELDLYPSILDGRITSEDVIEHKLAELEYVGRWLQQCSPDYMRVEHYARYATEIKDEMAIEQYQSTVAMLANWQQAAYEVKLAELHQFAVLQFTGLPIVSWVEPFVAKFAVNSSSIASQYLLTNWAKPTYFWTILGMELYIQENCNDKPDHINLAYMTKWMDDPRAANTSGWFQEYQYFMVREYYEAETGFKLNMTEWPLLNIEEEPDLPVCCFAELDGSLQCLDYGELCTGDMCPIPPL